MAENRRLLCTSRSKFSAQKFYKHWLPSNIKLTHDLAEAALGSTRLENYASFDRLVHATHVHVAQAIVKDNVIKAQAISDNSAANDCEVYPCLQGAQCVWVAPNCSTGSRFGPVVFQFRLWGDEVTVRQQL